MDVKGVAKASQVIFKNKSKDLDHLGQKTIVTLLKRLRNISPGHLTELTVSFSMGSLAIIDGKCAIMEKTFKVVDPRKRTRLSCAKTLSRE